MTTFVLVPGAWHGAWAWDLVVPLLGGATVVVPDQAGPDLRSHVEEVVGVLDAAGGPAGSPGGDDPARDVVLVGHSYAGLVVREAADRRPERVRHIVLVDGWAGPDGANLFDLAPDVFETVIRSMAGPDGRIAPPAPDLFGIEDEVTARWLGTRLRSHPLASFTERTRLTGAVDTIPGTGVFLRPQTFPFERIAASVGYRPIGLDGPHDVMLTDPHALAALLLTFRNEKPEE
ncbi:alpha/beta fold hydrolase [Spirillospora sp. NPDC047279]|uniref:alpha/beta fold hydrolase n=1 Tax=Spirillospora sp. NPDC047279 TaxID=3155478 RepID=UPI0033EFAD35